MTAGLLARARHCRRRRQDDPQRAGARHRCADFTKAHEVIERAMLSEDYREGQRAFLEKRAPVFTGR
jgi:enoyl-CoA hydratase/carnithine racemase